MDTNFNGNVYTEEGSFQPVYIHFFYKISSGRKAINDFTCVLTGLHVHVGIL